MTMGTNGYEFQLEEWSVQELKELSYRLLNNNSMNDIDVENNIRLVESYQRNRRVSEPYYTLLIVLYSILILLGTLGNSLVVTVVLRKPTMRTARNLFIFNLAVSDLLLCVITMPLTLMEILTTYWPLGNTAILCKTVKSLQAICVFVDTITIESIALDRYHVIVYPTSRSLQRLGAVLTLAGIWILSCLLAAPLFIWTILKANHIDFTSFGVSDIYFCYESWPVDHGRAIYSTFTIIFQYIIPVTVICFAYLGICKKLRYRMKPGNRLQVLSQRTDATDRDISRVRRTNILLISIALIFGISWMPLNVLNLVVDIFDPFKEDNLEGFLITYAFCHMVGMSSACVNPVLYGWLNENFRKEFMDIWSSVKACCFSRGESSNGRGLQGSIRGIEQTTVVYKKSNKDSPGEDGDIEQSTLITHVLK